MRPVLMSVRSGSTTSAEAHEGLARCHLRRHRWEDAADSALSAVGIDHHRPDAHSCWAWPSPGWAAATMPSGPFDRPATSGPVGPPPSTRSPTSATITAPIPLARRIEDNSMIVAAPILIEGHCQGEGGTIAVRPPTRGEMRACRMLLPEAFQSGRPPDLLVAAGASPLRYLGVAVLRPRASWRPAGLAGLDPRRSGGPTARGGPAPDRGDRLAWPAPRGGVPAGRGRCRDRQAADFLAACGFRAASRCTSL